jgi:cyclophilin family peptidyl-prolyl cis-trans isomerase
MFVRSRFRVFMPRAAAMLIGSAIVLIAACGGTEDSTNGLPNANGTATTPTTAASTTAASGTQAAAKKYATEPAMAIDVNKQYTATIATAKGPIVVALNAKAAPETVNNFVFLAREHFYDGLAFHRVEPGFVIQGGDPNGDGTGGPGYTIGDEFTNGLKHAEGVIAMARTSAPHSAGSQFYITLAPQPTLDGQYTVFGTVTSGMDVVKQIVRGDKIASISIDES